MIQELLQITNIVAADGYLSDFRSWMEHINILLIFCLASSGIGYCFLLLGISSCVLTVLF